MKNPYKDILGDGIGRAAGGIERVDPFSLDKEQVLEGACLTAKVASIICEIIEGGASAALEDDQEPFIWDI